MYCPFFLTKPTLPNGPVSRHRVKKPERIDNSPKGPLGIVTGHPSILLWALACKWFIIAQGLFDPVARSFDILYNVVDDYEFVSDKIRYIQAFLGTCFFFSIRE